MKSKEIREMAVKDLRERVEAEKVSLDQLKINHAISPIDDMSKIKKARRSIARMRTVLGEMDRNRS